jgi:hypothetical protein
MIRGSLGGVVVVISPATTTAFSIGGLLCISNIIK